MRNGVALVIGKAVVAVVQILGERSISLAFQKEANLAFLYICQAFIMQNDSELTRVSTLSSRVEGEHKVICDTVSSGREAR